MTSEKKVQAPAFMAGRAAGQQIVVHKPITAQGGAEGRLLTGRTG